MSATAVSGVLHRTMNDEAFLDRFRTDPESALSDFDLTDDERAALLSGDESSVYDVLGEAQLTWDISVVVVVVDS